MSADKVIRVASPAELDEVMNSSSGKLVRSAIPPQTLSSSLLVFCCPTCLLLVDIQVFISLLTFSYLHYCLLFSFLHSFLLLSCLSWCSSHLQIVIHFTADWCGSCKIITPSFTEFSNIYDASTYRVKF